MYQILCIDIGDSVVEKAVVAIMNDRQEVLPASNGRFQLITDNNTTQEGDGNAAASVCVIVGHGSAEGVSKRRSWNEYLSSLKRAPDDAKQIYIVACSTSAEGGSQFAYGNFARTVKAARPSATVWASETAVVVPSLRGNWTTVT